MMQMDDELVQRLSASLESLSERIGRLAIGLGISLDDQQAVQKLMDQTQIPAIDRERRVAPADGQASFTPMTGERRAAHLREEFGQPARSDAQRATRVAEMSSLIRSYLK